MDGARERRRTAGNRVALVKRSILLALAMALPVSINCQGLAERSTEPPPLLTVRGTISLAPGTTVDGGLRLALAWHPGLFNADEADGGADCAFTVAQQFVPQNVTYRPSFPIDYAFDITALPPRTAQRALTSDGTSLGTGALAALVVFRDDNGNGVLDACPEGATCADRVLGASGAVLPNGLPGGQPDRTIGFANALTAAADGGSGPGFFLVQASPTPALLPLPQTPIDIILSEAPILRTLTCENICAQIVVGRCAATDANCPMPDWPRDTNVQCDGDPTSSASARSITWLGADGCHLQTHVYVVEDGRPLPPWWPCP